MSLENSSSVACLASWPPQPIIVATSRHLIDCLLPILVTACVMPSYVRPFFMIGGAIIPRVFKALMSLKDVEKAAEQCVAERRAVIEKGEEVVLSLIHI